MGKIYSVYKASDSDEDDKNESTPSSFGDSDDDEKKKKKDKEDVDEDHRSDFEKEIDSLVELYYIIQSYLELLNYYPYSEFTVQRFGEDRLVPSRELANQNNEDSDSFEDTSCHGKCLAFFKSKKKEVEPPSKPEFEEQYFQVNRPIWVTKVGFYGPANISNTSYTVTLQLIKYKIPCSKKENATTNDISSKVKATMRGGYKHFGNESSGGGGASAGSSTGNTLHKETNSKTTIIGQTIQIIEAPYGQIFYVPFASRQPIPIEPNVWYSLKFRIQGVDATFIQHPSFKLATAIANCDRYGAVKFTFTTGAYDSSNQCPVLCFYKGKERLLPGIFNPTKEPISFENQLEVKDWVRHNKSYDPI